MKGGKLSSSDLKGLLDASYDPKVTQVGDFVLDKPLSSSTSKVYRNPDTGQVVVAHRGTAGISDWGNNAVYALGGKSAYKMTARYKEAEKVQKRAEKKYGASNVTTIGHSQGGLQSELLGGKSKEIITLNKATMPFESNKNKNQFDVRSDRDVVSGLNPFAKKSKKDISIKAESYNPLTEHSGDVLNRLDKDKMIGQGVYMKGVGRMEGGRMRPPTPPPPPPSRPIMPPHMFQLQANIAEGERRFITLRNRLPTTPVGLGPAIQNQMRIILAHLNELQDEFADGLMEYQERLLEYEDIMMRRGITMGRGISGSGSFFSKKKEEEKDPAGDLFSMPKNEGDQGFDLNKPKYPVEYHQGLNRDRKTTRYYSKKRIEALSNPKQEVQPAREAQEEKGAKVIAALKPSNPSDSSDWGITERRPTSPKKPLSIEGSFQKMALKSSTSDDELQFGIRGSGRMKGGVVVTPPQSPPPPPLPPPPPPPPQLQLEGEYSIEDEVRLDPIRDIQRRHINAALPRLMNGVRGIEAEINNQQIPMAIRTELLNYAGTNAETGMEYNLNRVVDILNRYPSRRLADEALRYMFYLLGMGVPNGQINPFIDAEDWNNGVFRDLLDEN